MKKISWAICDDTEYLCFSIKMDFSEYDQLECVGSASDCKTCLELLQSRHVDILLLDIQMETDTAGINMIAKAKELSPKTKIIMLTSYDYDDYIFTAFANGADDYIMKTTEAAELANTIVNVHQNKSALRPQIAHKLAQFSRDLQESQRSLLYMIEIMTRLSPSEFEILKDIYSGDTYKNIAAKRFVDLGTVKSHASRILKKFGTSNMAALIEQLKPLKIFDLFREAKK